MFVRFLIKSTITLVLALAILVGGWFTFALKYVYSRGERAGYVQKFSKKGWLIKTWEGEIAMVNLPGTMSASFGFTVRDPKIAEQISHTLGQRVVLEYEQHRFLPGTIFGETEYWVGKVRNTEGSGENDTLDEGLRGESSAPVISSPRAI